jgi:hypothetical protein
MRRKKISAARHHTSDAGPSAGAAGALLLLVAVLLAAYKAGRDVRLPAPGIMVLLLGVVPLALVKLVMALGGH